ncbi:Hsp70 family protein [Phytomonospora sp. NPDC050363]|uniref:Hsp70 family protein n=1 Tax=Phytomonospora sp. NPDC050363 TaxID=3155642 RepID=UPI0033F53F41
MLPSPQSAGLGVDFGTSHTVAMLRRFDGRVEPLMFDSSPLLPSAVFAPAEGTLLVGRDALDSARRDPSRFEPNPKRRIDDGTVLLGERELPVGELFAAVLGRVRRECVEVTGALPPAVSLTYPAAWGPARRLVLADAARQAGFPEPRLVPEPVAAATYFARHLQHEVPLGSAVVVHDFGGGTFDASVVRRTAEGFEVLAVDGLDDLGGVDVDEAIVGHLRSRVGRPELWHRLLNPASAAEARYRRTFAEDVRLAKERLSRHTSADLFLPLFDTDVHLTRGELEEITAPMLARAVRVVQAVIRVSGAPREAIAGVFLVGGSSRMPLVATMLHRELGTPPTVIDQIEQVVAHGALLDTSATASATPAVHSPPMGQVYPPPSGQVHASPVYAPVFPPPLTRQVETPAPAWTNVPPPLPERERGRAKAVLRTFGSIALTLVLLSAVGIAYYVYNGLPGGAAGDGSLGDSADPTTVYTGHTWLVEHLAVADLDGRAVVVSGSKDETIQVWDASTGVEITSFDEHGGMVEGLAVGEGKDGGPVVASYGFMNDEIFVWNPADGKVVRKIATAEQIGSPSYIATGKMDGKPVVVGVSGGTNIDGEPETNVGVWNLATGKAVADWDAPINANDLAVAEVGGEPVVVLAGLDADERFRVDVLAMPDGDSVTGLKPVAGGDRHRDPMSALVGVGGGEQPTLVTVDGNATPELWNSATGARLGDFQGHSAALTHLDAVQWNDRTVVVSGADDVVRVWDTAGETLAEYDLSDIDNAFGLQQVACGVVGGRLVVVASVFVDDRIHTWMSPVAG